MDLGRKEIEYILLLVERYKHKADAEMSILRSLKLWSLTRNNQTYSKFKNYIDKSPQELSILLKAKKENLVKNKKLN